MIESQPSGVFLPTEIIPFYEIYDSFAASENGEYLATCLRYNDYRPSGVSGDEWVSLLGGDVNNLEHMELTMQMTGEFLRIGKLALANGESVSPLAQFDRDEEALLQLTATFHDWGESVTGCEDITYRLKTEADESREHAALQTLFYDQAVGVTRNAEDAAALHAEMEYAREHVLKDRNSKLGQAFNAIERMGYMRTALRALRVAETTEDAGIQNSMEWIAADVFGGQTIKLLEYGEVYPAVREFLTANEDAISQGFTVVPDQAFANYALPEQKKQKDKFDAAKKKWEVFINRQEVEVFAAFG